MVNNKRHDFGKKIIYWTQNVFWFSLQILSEPYLILKIIKRAIIIRWAAIAQSVWRLAIGWTGRGSNPGGGEIFRTCPDRPWDPPSLLYNGYRVFPGGKVRPGRGVGHPRPSNAEIKERVELHLYSSPGPSWHIIGWPLPLTYQYTRLHVK
jgi:hypothetical protein